MVDRCIKEKCPKCKKRHIVKFVTAGNWVNRFETRCLTKKEQKKIKHFYYLWENMNEK